MIKVMIERYIAEDLASHYLQLANSTLQAAMAAQGFISGESLQDANNPNHRIIFANFRTLDHWLSWYQSPERKELLSSLRPLLISDEKITLMEHI
ncbi:MAG: antibiotic biosynthesis monooxygenase family protein [Motiliproteus sp.]